MLCYMILLEFFSYKEKKSCNPSYIAVLTGVEMQHFLYAGRYWPREAEILHCAYPGNGQ